VQSYVLDRFYVATNGGAGVVQQVAGTGGFTKAMRITGASGVTDGYFGQKVESFNIADCASSTVTYKIRASSSVLTSLTWYARFPNGQDNYSGVTLITSGSITINSTPTDYSFQISLPSGVTNGFEVYFTFGAFTSGTLDITGVQLEKGSTATSFDYRPYGTELALCQRYYEKSYDVDTALGAITNAGTRQASNAVAFSNGVTTRNFILNGTYAVAKRAAPNTITLYDPSRLNASGKISGYSSAAQYTVSSIAGSGTTCLGTYIVTATSPSSSEMSFFQFTADAEL
jgi:hypothetical protein